MSEQTSTARINGRFAIIAATIGSTPLKLILTTAIHISDNLEYIINPPKHNADTARVITTINTLLRPKESANLPHTKAPTMLATANTTIIYPVATSLIFKTVVINNEEKEYTTAPMAVTSLAIQSI